MIVVDSSVWIAQLRDAETDAVRRLHAIDDLDTILVGDLVLLEILRGARDDAHAARIERALRRFAIAAMLDDALAVEAARNHRILRRLGMTIRRAADLVIGTFCIAHGHTLLHADRDFDPMARHLGQSVL